jgi:type IV fimbrial biogenesis protein FimT
MTQGRGFSLIELIVAVALLAILTSLAIPSLHRLQEHNRITSSTNLLLTHIQLARIRAIMDAATVVICPSMDGAICTPDNEAWSHGWLVFKDYDFSLPAQLDPEDTLLLAHQNGNTWAAVNTAMTHIRYSPAGDSARNGTLTLCSRSDSLYARAIIISIVGRARVSKATPDECFGYT